MPELCQKGAFSPEIRMKGIFVYVPEFKLTLDKMQNISILMCKSLISEGKEFLKLFKLFILYT